MGLQDRSKSLSFENVELGAKRDEKRGQRRGASTPNGLCAEK